MTHAHKITGAHLAESARIERELERPMTDTPSVIPAYLGWKNDRDGEDGQNLRLYACDKERPSGPRWSKDSPVGRTIEVALAEHYGSDREGDRYLVVRLGNRFVTEEDVALVAGQIQALILTDQVSDPDNWQVEEDKPRG